LKWRAEDTDTKPELVFKFDSDDIHLDNTKDEGRVITMAAFRNLLKDSRSVRVIRLRWLTYNVDGTSTFSVQSRS